MKEAESHEDGDSPVTITSQWEGTRERIVQAEYEIVFSHAEALLSREDGLKVLQGTIYLSAVKAVIVEMRRIASLNVEQMYLEKLKVL